MLRIGKLTDYALVLLAHLARSQHVCMHPASDLAESTGIPVPTVAKVLKVLAREGLVVSHRGSRGGYALARDPAAISVVDVVEALEGPVAITDCSHVTGVCLDQGRCDLSSHWPRINAAVREALVGVTLLELARTVRAVVPTASASRGLPRVSLAQGGH